MLRIRFHANHDDPRPIRWPVKHPYWITGYGNRYSTIVSYADDIQYVLDNWPEATTLTVQNVDDYEFTSRFPKPEWWQNDKT